MSRSIFGWDLPPGCTMRHIEEAAGGNGPCECCGNAVDDCICPECPTCEAYGDPNCYKDHGLTLLMEQIEGQAWLEYNMREQSREEPEWP